jgi:large subunit ribosomal protein L29
MSKTSELRDLSTEDLRQRERDLDDQLFRLRLQKSTGGLESTAKVRTGRRELARVKTIIREKERG